ncbi:MAG: cytochrome c [Nitrospirae bacterium]|nr:cytochrome c [Nitrospirota bacterium]
MQVKGKDRILGKKNEWKSIAIPAIVVLIIGIVGGYLWAQSNSIMKKKGSGLSPKLVARGEGLYKKNCIACHGEKGAGENPADIYAMDSKGNYVAPPLNESAHAWHHTDEQLVEIILDGSSINPRMIAWKNQISKDDARTLVEYIKSLWSERIRKYCQGPKHMECM